MEAIAGERIETRKEMKKGILEILVVNAEGIGHTNVVGTQAYYVVIQCGNDAVKSKVSSGEHKKAWWNEKFSLEFPLTDWKRFTHLKFRIMDTELFAGSGFVGETIIYIGGIINEGIYRQVLEMKPSAYNVVLEDDTYRGEIKIGFKFSIHNEATDRDTIFQFQNEVAVESRELPMVVNEARHSVCKSIFNLWKLSWRRLWCYCNIKDSTNKTKQDHKDN